MSNLILKPELLSEVGENYIILLNISADRLAVREQMISMIPYFYDPLSEEIGDIIELSPLCKGIRDILFLV